MAVNRTFRTDVIKELGIDANLQESQLLQLAVQHPSEYFALRNELLRGLVSSRCEEVYSLVFNCLTEGRDDRGIVLMDMSRPARRPFASTDRAGNPRGGGYAYQPQLPESQVNQIAMSVAKGYTELLEREIVEKLLPKKMFDIALEKTVTRSKERLSALA